jgi:hypothetical protein
MGQEWSSHGGSRFDRMNCYIDRHGRMNVANPTFEEMARQWFATFGTNQVLSRLLALALGFLVVSGWPGEHLVDIGGGSPASYPGGDMEVHHFRGWWTRMSNF